MLTYGWSAVYKTNFYLFVKFTATKVTIIIGTTEKLS